MSRRAGIRDWAGPMTMLSAAALLLLGAEIATAQSLRELDAHQHGHGRVNLAIDGGSVWIELEAPGADIVGFEHKADSDSDRAAVEAARALLGRPLALFALPADARCSVDAAEVALSGGDDQAGGGHNEFHAEYLLACAEPARLNRVDFSYFEHFPAAQELEVNLIANMRQYRFEVDRDNPLIAIESK